MYVKDIVKTIASAVMRLVQCMSSQLCVHEFCRICTFGE